MLAEVVLTGVSTLGLTAAFYAVCVVCDGHLVPAVEVFIQQLRIPEDIAGVTLVAFGSAAPELFLNTVAAFEKDSGNLSLPAVLGSAVIAFGLIPSLCILTTNQKEDAVQLSAYPIIRETFFYLLGLSTFCMAIQDGEIEYEEALGMIMVYAVYVGSVAGFYIMASGQGPSSPYSSDINMRSNSDDVDSHAPLLTTIGTNVGEVGSGDGMISLSSIEHGANSPMVGLAKKNSSPLSNSSPSKTKHGKGISPSIKSRSNSSGTWVASSNSNISNLGLTLDHNESEDVEEVQGPSSVGGELRVAKLVLKSLWEYITVPVNHIVSSLFPTLVVVGHDNETKKPIYTIRSAVCTLCACVVAVSVLAYAIIAFTKLLVAQIGVGTTTIGATLVSLGAEIPDTISSVSLARNGHHDGAMAGAIGSQVINITLGVGLPALISCWLYGGSLLIEPAQIKSLWLLTSLVFVVVLGYAAVSLPFFRLLSCTMTRYTSIRRPGAIFLAILWAACNVGFVLTNEELLIE